MNRLVGEDGAMHAKLVKEIAFKAPKLQAKLTKSRREKLELYPECENAAVAEAERRGDLRGQTGRRRAEMGPALNP
jgi:hypothetical protein